MDITFYRHQEIVPIGEGEDIQCNFCSTSLAGKMSFRHDVSDDPRRRIDPHCEACIENIVKSTNECSSCHFRIKEIRSCSYIVRHHASKVAEYIRNVNWTMVSFSIVVGGGSGTIAGILIAGETLFTPALWIGPIVGTFCGRAIYPPLICVADRLFARCFG